MFKFNSQNTKTCILSRLLAASIPAKFCAVIKTRRVLSPGESRWVYAARPIKVRK